MVQTIHRNANHRRLYISTRIFNLFVSCFICCDSHSHHDRRMCNHKSVLAAVSKQDYTGGRIKSLFYWSQERQQHQSDAFITTFSRPHFSRLSWRVGADPPIMFLPNKEACVCRTSCFPLIHILTWHLWQLGETRSHSLICLQQTV